MALKKRAGAVAFASIVLIVVIIPIAPLAADAPWTTETVESCGYESFTSLALDSLGNPHIAFFDSNLRSLRYTFLNGDSWQTMTVDSTVDAGRYSTSLALDSTDKPHISYSDGTNDILKYASFNGTGWDTETVDDDGSVGQYASLAIDSSDRPHISYLDLANRNLKYASWNGTLWDKYTVDDIREVQEYTSLALDSSGYPHISYYDKGNGNLRYAYKDNKGWDISTTVDDIGDVGQYSSLALDSSGHPHISYFDYTNCNLKYAYKDGGGWHTDTVNPSAAYDGTYTSLALDSSGRPRIGYLDVTNTDLKYASLNGTWDITTVDSNGDVGWYTSLALGSAGNPCVGYLDVTNMDLKYAYLKTVPVVETDSPANITTTSAASGGNVMGDGGDPVTARGVCWSTSENPTIANSRTIDGSGTGSFTSSITGLNPETSYYVRAYATNSEGTSYGTAETFTTEGPPPTPTNWYLAEGTTAWGFDTYISIENPNDSDVDVDITYNTSEGEVSGGTITLPPMSQTTVNPSQIVPDKDFSTLVTAPGGETIAVDRTMEWTGEGATSSEAHNSIGVNEPAATWYLPEGSTNWDFETWLLIQNPGDTDAVCRVTYMIEGGDPVTLEKTVPAGSRKSYSMADDIGAHDASIKVESDQPVIPERSMYRYNRREGHDSIGTTTPAQDYYLAEGAVGYDSGYTTYVLVQNPGNQTNRVTVTYLTGTGEVTGPTIDMPANSRTTVRVNDYLPSSTDVSTHVHGESPIIAERAMYWNSTSGEACHDSIGMAAPHSAFYLPDGETSNGRETWTLVSNPSNEDVPVEIAYLPGGGGTPVLKDEVIPANSRKSFNMQEHSGINGRASIRVTGGLGRKIMVERAMYWNSRGAGTDTIGGYSD